MTAVTEFTPLAGLAGGALIGLAAVLLMGAAGRVMGASGALGGLLTLDWGFEARWRALFVLGLLGGAMVGARVAGVAVQYPGPVATVVGGLLVGTGTALGNGCTSGHGLCGLARLSSRSLAATVTFMAVALVTVALLRPFG